MTKGDAGQNISKFASNSRTASVLTTSLPYISYVDLAKWLDTMYQHLVNAVDSYITSTKNHTATGFKDYCSNSSSSRDVFICDGYRICRAAKLLMSLGYGNFSNVVRYDVFAMAMSFVAAGNTWSKSAFLKSDYSLSFQSFEASAIYNSPNLSLLPLLAYHKICNDHYRNDKWQPFEPWTCNIDYLLPSDSMNAWSFIDRGTFNTLITSKPARPSLVAFKNFCDKSTTYNDVFICDG